MARPPEYEVFAIRYATRDAVRRDHFIGPPPGDDPHDGPMPMDYFVWVVRNADRTFIIDTGFDRADAEKRNRRLLRRAVDGVAAIGVETSGSAGIPAPDIIMTHLHYDHAGGLEQFPASRIHLQDDEMRYATGRHMMEPGIAHAFEADHIAQMVHRVFDRQAVFHDGDADLAPGLSVHKVGGHTLGLQVVRVHTRIGWIVLASDACHYYENFLRAQPFPIVHDLGRYLGAFHRLRDLADDEAFVIPGHDPLVCRRYAAVDGLDGIAYRLDAEPVL